jgi:hypothetical protein
MARAKPVPTALPLGGRMVGAQEPLPFGLVCPHHGGPEAVAWQPSQQRGQSGGDASPAAALTGPLQAGLTGSTDTTTRARATARRPRCDDGGLARQYEAGGTPGRRGIRPAVTRSRLLP